MASISNKSADPLLLIREFMTLISTCAPLEATSWNFRLFRRILFAIIMFCLTFGWVSSIDFIIKYLETDLQSALYAIFQIAAEFSAFYTVFVTYLNRKTVLTSFIKFKEIRENGKISSLILFFFLHFDGISIKNTHFCRFSSSLFFIFLQSYRSSKTILQMLWAHGPHMLQINQIYGARFDYRVHHNVDCTNHCKHFILLFSGWERHWCRMFVCTIQIYVSLDCLFKKKNNSIVASWLY